MQNRNIYILGNPLLEEDSLPLKLLPKLKTSFLNYNFLHLDPTEEFPEEEHLILIDTIINTKKIQILTEKDINKIQNSPNVSLHDFDLSMQLKLMKKLNKIKKLTIIGFPPNINENGIIKKIQRILTRL